MTDINWRSLIATLNKKTESEVKAMLDAEASTHRRPTILRRLHQRYASLRTARERAELLGE